jgi:hypothetical protein
MLVKREDVNNKDNEWEVIQSILIGLDSPATESKEDNSYGHDAPPVIILLGKMTSANNITTNVVHKRASHPSELATQH